MVQLCIKVVVMQSRIVLFTHSLLELYKDISIFENGDYKKKYNEIYEQVHNTICIR